MLIHTNLPVHTCALQCHAETHSLQGPVTTSKGLVLPVMLQSPLFSLICIHVFLVSLHATLHQLPSTPTPAQPYPL